MKLSAEEINILFGEKITLQYFAVCNIDLNTFLVYVISDCTVYLAQYYFIMSVIP
jgi:hypothetical protein